jgi:hypothetical protein
MSQGPVVIGETCQYDWLPWISCVLSASAKNAAIAATGGVNRLGTSVPAANPSADRASRLAATTATGHHSGPPQAACRAVTPYRAATQPRQPIVAQHVVAAQVARWRAHRGRAVIVTRSFVWWRASRDAIHAAAPATGQAKASRMPLCMLVARRFHSGGMAMALL